jgi:hypothetical protein
MKPTTIKTITLLTTILLLTITFIPVTTSHHHTTLPTTYRPADGTTNKFAVLIACSGGVTYERHERRDRNDIKKLTTQLLQNGWTQDHILILLEEQATTDAILTDTFQWLQDHGEDQDDLILFFYSGHGYYHTHDEPPLDEPDDVDEVIYPWDPDMAGWNWDVIITDDTLSQHLNTLNSQNQLIIIHTCHAGGFIDGTSDLKKSGRVVHVACDVDEASCMMLFPIHWLYPYYLIKGLKGWADTNHDNTITAEELLHYTKLPVQIRSNIYNWIHTRYFYTQHPLLFDGWPTIENNQQELKIIEKR